ncbi:MAG: nucleotidyltransferase domain-containing protein [Spirochaetaceae bacterium]|nr:MAG: nucleotidyltransferase domain-containing protein [Spirochaetaceae bacterium]
MEDWPVTMRRFLQRRRMQRERTHQELHQRAAAQARDVVELIGQRYRPRRIIQWGSVLHPELFREFSDIDIAVEGITDPELFFRLVGDAEKLTTFPLDIVQLEQIDPAYRALILRKGVVVYECPQ